VVGDDIVRSFARASPSYSVEQQVGMGKYIALCSLVLVRLARSCIPLCVLIPLLCRDISVTQIGLCIV
jgi:hypothetical protein